MSDRFLESLHADPSVATCSVLASQLSASADRLLEQPDEGMPDSYTVLSESTALMRKATRTKSLGTTAIQGLDVRLVQFDVEDKPNKGLYSLIRGNLLLQLATFATTSVGPCNYVQFPGEIAEGMVLTPYDEERRKPLLQELLRLDQGYDPGVVAIERVKGFGYDLDPFASERIRLINEYILCPDEDVVEAGQKLIAECGDFVNFKGNAETVSAVYATVLGRFNGPLTRMYGTNNRIQSDYEDFLYRIRKNPLDPIDTIYNVGSLELAVYYRSLQPKYGGGMKLDSPLLEQLALTEFKKEIGSDYDATHEAILAKIFRHKNATYTKTVEDGYESPDKSVTADVEYTLDVADDDGSRRGLSLYARVTTMTDIAPTLCATFSADQLGTLQSIRGDGEPHALEPSQIIELEDILSSGTVKVHQRAKAVETRKRRVFRRK